jgi:hypothetical protein
MQPVNQAAEAPDGVSADGKIIPWDYGRRGPYERAEGSWYVEPKWCVEQLADAISFDDCWIWDPCCGGGSLIEVFEQRRRFTIATDLVDRGFPRFDGVHDALSSAAPMVVSPSMKISVVTNPPFERTEELVRRLISMVDHRLAILQKVSFLASQVRFKLFEEFPPSDVLILSRRPSMPPGAMIAEMGDNAFRGGKTDYCWVVWTRPHDRETRLRWLAPGGAS